MRLRPQKYQYKTDVASLSANAPVCAGFMAEDVEAVFPEFVRKDEHGALFAVDNNSLLASAITVIQDLITRVKALEGA